jgi:drug/metabolite transporter (DMT)-like permease
MGILAALLSAIFSTSKDIVSKKLSVRIDGTASTFASFGFALPFYVILLAALGFLGHDIFTFEATFWWLVVARAVTDVFAEWTKMYAFVHGDISLVTIIFSISPLCVLVLSPFLTGDPLSVSGALAVVVVVAGSAAAVYRPSHPDWARQKKAILLAAGASLFFGLNSIYDRLAVREQPAAQGQVSAEVNLQAEAAGSDTFSPVPLSLHSGTAFLVKPAVAGFAMTALSAALLLPFVLFRPARLVDMAHNLPGLQARGLLEVSFMVFKLVAMKWLAAPYVVGLQRMSLLLSIIAGRVIFKEGDFRRRFFAGIVILAGVLWILWEQLER